MYDMYAGVVLCSISLVLFLLTYMLKDGQTLGTPMEDNDESGRASLLDNAKFVMVSLVILHHSCCQPEAGFGMSRRLLLERPWRDVLFRIGCPLHTRTLCFISGILCRTNFKPEKVMVRLLAPFVAYCFILYPALNVMLRCLFGAHTLVINPLHQLFYSEGQLQWYLLALVWWRFLSSLIAPFSPHVRLLVACTLSAMASYSYTGFLSMDMALPYFPAFVAGQLFPFDQAVSKLKWRPITALVGVLLIVGTACIRVYMETIPDLRYMQSLPMAFRNQVANPVDMPTFWLRGLAFTSMELFRSIVFLVLVCPRETYFFTQAGANSIYPYLLHLFALPWLCRAGGSIPRLDATLALPLKVSVVALDILICFGTCAALASWPVRVVFRPLIEPTWISKLFQGRTKGENK